ncbi:MAG: ATP-dependent helicase [Roseburia sp.]|nr:ATP-dependent helicase [Roseburia sp.]MCM1097395.1 ATP-dependent helicase [Ruminococcus flavefaciens]
MPDLTALNEAQRRAVTWGEGPLLLLAGPGSGKTFTITNRILFLLEQGTPPEQILVVTFTREAAASMQRRFQKMSETFYPVNFGTFHSVFYHILQKSAGLSRLKLLTGSQKKQLIVPIMKKYLLRSGGDAALAEAGEEAEGLLSAVSFYKNTEDLTRAADKAPAAYRGGFGEICGEYREAVRRAGGIDFDDMLFSCRELLRERPSLREYWQNRFRHILIDEFQDINPIQYEVLRLLSAPPYNLFAVGDDDQSIYGFRGSRPELMKRFEQEYRAGRMLLDINYRCAGEIVRASAAVIGENRERFAKVLRPAPEKAARLTPEERAVHRPAQEEILRLGAEKTPRSAPSDRGVRLKGFPGREEQASYLTEELRRWQEKDEKAGKSCAVLFRTNASLQRTATKLKGAGISFVIREKTTSIYEHFIVKDIMAYLLLATDGERREALLRILNRPRRQLSREALAAGGGVREMIRYYEREPFYGEAQQEALAQLRLLQTQLKNLGRMKPGLGVSYVLKAMKYESYLKSRARGNPELWEEWQELLDWLKSDAASFESAEDWLEMQKSYTAELERQPPAAKEEKEGGIRLLTAHASKGLEFDRVLIPDCNERVFPHGNMPDLASVEEERRLFYVAMTRAKETLELLYLAGDRMRPRVPSRFLNPLLCSDEFPDKEEIIFKGTI